MEDLYKVYAKHQNNLVYKIYSTCFEKFEEGDIFVKEGSGDEFVHVSYYQTLDFNGCHNYKIVDGEMVETTEQEKLLEFKTNSENNPQPLSNQELTNLMTELILQSL